jgi:hypothetical protein
MGYIFAAFACVSLASLALARKAIGAVFKSQSSSFSSFSRQRGVVLERAAFVAVVPSALTVTLLLLLTAQWHVVFYRIIPLLLLTVAALRILSVRSQRKVCCNPFFSMFHQKR